MTKKKPNPADLTLRNLHAMMRRVRRLEQRLILLEGDRNKTNTEVNELRVLVDRALQYRP